MARKSKSKIKKKNKGKEKLWCTEDLDFDEDGNLCVTNPALSQGAQEGNLPDRSPLQDPDPLHDGIEGLGSARGRR